MSDDDPIRIGPALRREPSSDEDVIRVAPRPPGLRGRGLGRGNRGGRPRELPQSGTFACWFVIDSNPRPSLESSDAPERVNRDSPGVGALAVCQWRYVLASAETDQVHASLHEGSRRTKAGPALGYVQYHIVKIWVAEDPYPLPNVDVPVTDPCMEGILCSECAEELVDDNGTTVNEALSPYIRAGVRVLSFPPSRLDEFSNSTLPVCFRSVRVGPRSDLRGLIRAHPPVSSVHAWRKREGVPSRGVRQAPGEAQGSSYEEMLLELPRTPAAPSTEPRTNVRGCVARDIDPLVIINAAGFSKFLRTTRDFSAAMNAANRFDHPDSDMDSRDDKADPRRTGLDNTVRKLDVMDLLLFRRKLHADAAHDMIVAINLYSDSSPVSGSEIQGMLMDIHRRNDDNERIELPGGNLSYGQFDAVSKSMCLLHALWLVAGPDAQTIRYCLRKVASITTDHGTEMHTLEMRDVVDAYCAYMQGASLEHCRTLVDVSSRWLPNALRISGWSHSMGNIMRHTAETTTRWPRILQQMRDLVGFSGMPLGGSTSRKPWRRTHPMTSTSTFWTTFAHRSQSGGTRRFRPPCRRYCLCACCAKSTSKPNGSQTLKIRSSSNPSWMHARIHSFGTSWKRRTARCLHQRSETGALE